MNKFYQLEPDEWLTVCKELKPAELKVLYRLRTLDPFGQHPIKFRVVDLARDLDMNKGTVSRAVQKLAELGYINLEIVEAIATLTTKSKRLSTDNSVVHRQQSPINIGCLQTTRLSTDNLNDRYTTSAIATQPESIETSSGQSTDLSKINIDQLERSRDHDLVVFENKNQENLVSVDDPISNRITPTVANLKPDQGVEYTNSPVKVINPITADSLRRALEDFILKSMSFSPRDRVAYFGKFTKKDWQDWEIKFKPPSSPPPPPAFVPEIFEVAPHDVALANIAKIREMLKRGVKCS